MLLLSGTQSDGPTQLLIEDNDIRDVSSAGIFIETPINHDVNSILISGNRFSDVQEHGVEMRIRGGSVSAVDILDNTWTDIGMDAMYFRSELGAFVEQLNIYDNTITQIDGHGISALLRLNSLATAHISMNSIVDTVKPAILFDVDENSLLRGTVAHNTVDPARTDGINAKVRQSTLDLVISHNVIAPRVFGGFHDAGIYILAFDDAVVSADISNNTIAQTGTGVLVEVLRNSSVFLAMNENTLNQLWWDAGSLNAMASSKIIAAVERNVLDENLLFAFSLLAIDHSHISATFVENGFTEYDLDIDNLGDVTAVIEVEFL